MKRNFKGKPSFKNFCKNCRIYGSSIARCSQKQQDNLNRPQKRREPNKLSYQYIKKIRMYQIQKFKLKLSQENHFQIVIVTIGYNPPIEIVFTEDHHIFEFHKTTRKINTADQITKIISIETTTQDQTQTEEIIKVIIRIILIRNLRIDTIQENHSRKSSNSQNQNYSNNRNSKFFK